MWENHYWFFHNSVGFWRIVLLKRLITSRWNSLLIVRPCGMHSRCITTLQSKKTVNKTIKFNQTQRAFFVFGSSRRYHLDNWTLFSMPYPYTHDSLQRHVQNITFTFSQYGACHYVAADWNKILVISHIILLLFESQLLYRETEIWINYYETMLREQLPCNA